MNNAEPGHPSDERLGAFSLGQVGDDELSAISEHLSGCPGCCGRLDGLAVSDGLLSRLQGAERPSGLNWEDSGERRAAVRSILERRNDTVDLRRGATVDAPSRVPTQVGEYDILAEVGRGGMGVVYKALHRGLKRPVALKMVLAGEFASPSQELRFGLEAELAARVPHANIVQVYEVGSHEGRPFLALEWVEGGSLAQRLDGEPWSAGEAARLIETLARAVQAAHDQGVLHRDLKPANVLMGATPKIADFGLAKRLDASAGPTAAGDILGTPSYMAPEQALGDVKGVGPSADIYALGAILYELLTGRPPFRAAGVLETLEQVRTRDPIPPRMLQPGTPRDLETVCLKCLRKEPARRYANAADLAEDLRRFAAGEPILARPVGTPESLAKAFARHPVASLLGLALLLSLLGGIGGISWKYFEAEGLRGQAVAAEGRATEKADSESRAREEMQRQRDRAAELAYAAALRLAHDDWRAGRVSAARAWLEACPPQARGWEYGYLSSLLTAGKRAFVVPGPTALMAAVSPEGKRVAVCNGEKLLLIDPATGEVTARADLAGPARPALAFSGNSKWLAVLRWVGDKGTVSVYDAYTLARRAELVGDLIAAVAVSPDGERVACATRTASARVLEVDTGREMLNLPGHALLVSALCFAPDGKELLTADGYGTVRVWDAAGRSTRQWQGPQPGSSFRLAVSRDGSQVALGTNGFVYVWGRHGESRRVLPHADSPVSAVAFSPDGRRLASAGADRLVSVWELDHLAAAPRVLRGHDAPVLDVGFLPDSRSLATVSSGPACRTFDVGDEQEYRTIPAQVAPFRLVSGPNGALACSAIYQSGNKVRFRVWVQEAGGQPRWAHDRELDPRIRAGLDDVAFDPRGAWVLVASTVDGHSSLLDAATGLPGLRLPSPAVGCSFAEAGSLLVLMAADGTVPVYDRAGKELHRWSEQFMRTAQAALGSRILTGTADGRVLARDPRDGRVLFEFEGKCKGAVIALAVSHDGRRVAASDAGGGAFVWDADGKRLATLGHPDGLRVVAVAFDPTGGRVATGGFDGNVRLWRVSDGQPLLTLGRHSEMLRALAWTSDGRYLLSSGGELRAYDGGP